MKKFLGILSNPNGRLSRTLNLATMYSKYGIAVLLLFLTWKWNYFVPFLASIIASFLVGLAIHQFFRKMVWTVKYAVTLVELVVIQALTNSILGNHLNLALTAIFTLPLLLNMVVETVEHIGLSIPNRGVGRMFYLISGNLFGVERVCKFTLGAYYSFVFGLASLTNEVVLLWSFGIIGSSEYSPTELVRASVKVVHHTCHVVARKFNENIGEEAS